MSNKLLKQRAARPMARGPASAAETPVEVREMLHVPKDRPQHAAIALDQLVPNPRQPRTVFDEGELQELAESIRRVGLLQPILVRQTGERDRWQIIAGERRVRACRILGFETINAIVSARGDAAEIALIENVQRTDLDPVDLARSLQSLIDEHDYTHAQVAQIVGKDESQVTKILGILNLPADILSDYQRVRPKAATLSNMIELAAVKDAEQARLLWDQVKNGLSVRELRDARRDVQRIRDAGQANATAGGSRPDGALLLKLGRTLGRFDKEISTFHEHRAMLQPEHRERLTRLRDQITLLLGE